MLLALAWQDHAVVAAYFAALVGMGWHFARKQKSGAEYFLASRRVPWFALGLSIMATLMSSLTYLSEPGEVWLSGVTTIVAKWIAILTEMVVVLFVIIPFLMRFRFTSVYEYLEYRFGRGPRRLAVALFLCLIVSWMGFVVLAMSWTVSRVTGVHLWIITATVGGVGTVYTMVGGMRAVIWKEVLQVALMLGGCLVCIGYVLTHGTNGDWLAKSDEYRRAVDPGSSVLTWIPNDAFDRISVAGFAATMFVWHLCTHLGNQMVVQRYFSSSDLKAARRSFLTAVGASIVVNTLLVVAGLALVSFYLAGHGQHWFDPYHLPKRDADLIFPMFMVNELPPGLAGAVLTAVLSAAMSTLDSGVNAIATVISVERRSRREGEAPAEPEPHLWEHEVGVPVNARGSAGASPSRENWNEVRFAKMVTLVAGLCITAAAYALNLLVKDRNILEMMPRSFNCFLVPLGGMFFLGFFVPRCGPRAAVLASLTALVTAVSLAYSRELYGIVDERGRPLSFTLILPVTFGVLLVVGLAGSVFDRATPDQTAGLTWFTRRQRPNIPPHLLAPNPPAPFPVKKEGGES